MAKRTPNVEQVTAIQGTPVLPFIIDAYTALRRAGNIEPNDAPASGDEEAFYVTSRGKVIAVLSFFESVPDVAFTINMGFVAPAHRRKGLYALLWARLVAEATERHLERIIGYHKPTNGAILGFNERAGRKIKYVCSEYTIQTPKEAQ
jgi:GNAT superfamily N-acetyltransferase